MLSQARFVESPQWWYKIDAAGIQSGPYYFDETGAPHLMSGGALDDSGIIAAVEDISATLAAGAGGSQDNGPFWVSRFGIAGVRFTSANQSASAASVTDVPTVGQKLIITDCLISVDTAMRVDLKEETTGTVLASLYMGANSSYQMTPRSELKLATVNKRLQVQTSVAGNIAVTAFYHSEA